VPTLIDFITFPFVLLTDLRKLQDNEEYRLRLQEHEIIRCVRVAVVIIISDIVSYEIQGVRKNHKSCLSMQLKLLVIYCVLQRKETNDSNENFSREKLNHIMNVKDNITKEKVSE